MNMDIYTAGKIVKQTTSDGNYFMYKFTYHYKGIRYVFWKPFMDKDKCKVHMERFIKEKNEHLLKQAQEYLLNIEREVKAL